MGLWDRVRGKGRGGYREEQAKERELSGDFEEAVRLYVEAELPEEAARVLVSRADVEPALGLRVALLERAAAVGGDTESGTAARKRRARLVFDMVKGSAATAKGEVAAAAKALEEAGEHLVAAEAYALVGDTEAEVRALTEAGAIELLEERLGRDASVGKREQELSLALRRVRDLDRAGERREALRVAQEAMDHGARDVRLEDAARTVRQRIVRGPIVELAWDGKLHQVALGSEVTIGRGEATIVVGSRSISRVHLKLMRRDGIVLVADAGTRNGTSVRGAKLSGPVPVGDAIDLTLGPELSCRIESRGALGVGVLVAGAEVLVPLGPLELAGWKIAWRPGAGPQDAYVTLESSPEAPAYLGSLAVAASVELCLGDRFARERGGATALEVGRVEEGGA